MVLQIGISLMTEFSISDLEHSDLLLRLTLGPGTGLKKLCSRGMLLLVRILLIYLVTPAVRGLTLLK